MNGDELAAATRQTLLDRLGHELNEAQARRQRLATTVYVDKQHLTIATRAAEESEKTAREWIERAVTAKREVDKLTRLIQQNELLLNENLRLEEAIRARYEAARRAPPC